MPSPYKARTSSKLAQENLRFFVSLAENRGVVPTLKEASLVTQEPSPMADAVEGMWLDSASIHSIASN